jgi:hypothetical protein
MGEGDSDSRNQGRVDHGKGLAKRGDEERRDGNKALQLWRYSNALLCMSALCQKRRGGFAEHAMKPTTTF